MERSASKGRKHWYSTVKRRAALSAMSGDMLIAARRIASSIQNAVLPETTQSLRKPFPQAASPPARLPVIREPD